MNLNSQLKLFDSIFPSVFLNALLFRVQYNQLSASRMLGLGPAPQSGQTCATLNLTTSRLDPSSCEARRARAVCTTAAGAKRRRRQAVPLNINI